MTEKRTFLPSLFHHKRSGQSAVQIRNPDGKRRTVYLGAHGSQAAQERYRELLSDVLAG